MGNYISAEPSDSPSCFSTLQQSLTSYYTSCLSTPEQTVQPKNKYQNYTDEIAVNPKDQLSINLELAYHLCTNENTPIYTYENIKKLVKILNVVDGDTVDIALYYEDTRKIFKHRVRLYGIDTPEKRPSLSNPERAKEIDASHKAKEALLHRLQENDNLVIALFHKFDKYGRLMATLYDKQGDDINKWLITTGHAQEYFGKTKKKFVEFKPLMVSEQEYFDTPRTSETAPDTEPVKDVEQKEPEESEEDDFEEFPEEVTKEVINDIRIV